MTTYTYSQLEQIWTQAASGTSYDTSAWASLMAAIGLAESSGNDQAVNPDDNNGTQSSYGIWQISNGTHTAPASNWSSATANAALAVQKLESQGLSAWGTYASGAYQQYLPTGTTLPPGAASGSTTGGAASATGATAASAASATAGASTTSAGGTIINWLEAPVKGFEWAGNFITGGAVGSITTEAQGLQGIVEGIVGITTMFSKLSQLWLTLMSPAFWLRIGAFILGIVSLFWGFHFLKESL